MLSPPYPNRIRRAAMRMTIAAVGRMRGRPEAALFDAFLRRIRPPPQIREVEERRKLPTPARIEREGALLIAALPEGATQVALDERGMALGSIAFARRIAAWRDDGVADLGFAIGGADGLAPAVLERAEATLSFGPATWPHLLARVMLTEQIYRAQQILAGHPYHRE